MRPHRLSFAGIGPYPSLIEIDFDDLSSLGLYLIVGPTGAGKTTIFDAISYSLYGKLAGVRSSQQIISDHENASAPSVELEFSHRGRRYTVTRKPSPPGKTARPNDHVLSIHPSEDQPSQSSPAAQGIKITGASKVTTEIESILGLDASQFNRVMLLPQNEFQQFLLANSSDKEKLLRSLFDTDLFHRTEDELERVARELASEAEEAARQLSNAETQVVNEYDLLVETGLLAPASNPEEISVESVISEVSALHGTALATKELLTAQAQAATEARSAAVTELLRFEASVELNDLRSTAEELRPVLQHDEHLLRGHNEALTIAQEIQRRDKATELVTDAVHRLATARAEASSRTAVLVPLHPLVAQLHESIHNGLPTAIASAFTGLRSTLVAAAERHASAIAAHELSTDRRARHASILAELPRQAELLRTTEQNHSVQRGLLDQAQAAALNIGDLRSAVEDLQRRELAADTSGPEAAVIEAKAEFEAAALAAASAQDALDRSLMARTQFLAGELAQTLTPGDPCPVCGSPEHPEIAPLSPDAPDNAAIAEARDRAYERRLRAETELASCLSAHALAQEAADQLPPLAEREDLRSLYSVAEDARRRIPELTEIVQQLHDAITTQRADLAAMESEAARALSEATQAESDAAEHLQRAEIPAEQLRDLSALLDALSGFTDELQILVDLRSRHEPIVADAKARVEELLETSGFTNEADATSAMLDEAALQQITDRTEAALARNQRITRLEGVIGDGPLPDAAPDVDALTAAETEVRSQADAAAVAVTQLAEALKRLTTTAHSLRELGPAVAAKVSRAARFREIVTIIRNGKMPHFALERWVQRAIFTDVCEVASERIKVLSAGRYLLTLDAEDGRSRAHAAGLDLYVTDSHTGRTRPVQTLSGGEQFLTSLALALALADVVQQMSGGMELASLFIDEGFGSLDAETLDTAVDVLRSLQDSGRAVGVISHVEAMQSDLPVGIRVSPAPTGSSITFPALRVS
jgi:DNA repair protein SbcC/Rad50